MTCFPFQNQIQLRFGMIFFYVLNVVQFFIKTAFYHSIREWFCIVFRCNTDFLRELPSIQKCRTKLHNLKFQEYALVCSIFDILTKNSRNQECQFFSVLTYPTYLIIAIFCDQFTIPFEVQQDSKKILLHSY